MTSKQETNEMISEMEICKDNENNNSNEYNYCYNEEIIKPLLKMRENIFDYYIDDCSRFLKHFDAFKNDTQKIMHFYPELLKHLKTIFTQEYIQNFDKYNTKVLVTMIANKLKLNEATINNETYTECKESINDKQNELINNELNDMISELDNQISKVS